MWSKSRQGRSVAEGIKRPDGKTTGGEVLNFTPSFKSNSLMGMVL
ncbi:MAG: hypothetical protein QM305_13645 [Bacteroidota bacterium]|nr:hypothetical protein [Bacteroidota bacterium]